MMKLKYLFNNEDLALMCLKNWAFDKGSTELFKYFRISSNAIYPFRQDGQLQFLRFSPVEEKTYKQLEGEVQLLNHLDASASHIPAIIPSKNGRAIEYLDTPFGCYYAMVFRGIVSHNGCSMEETDLNEEIVYELGCILATIHKKTNTLTQETCFRPSIDDQLLWIKDTLIQYGGDSKLVTLTDNLILSIKEYPRHKASYGLLHYDFELDNLIMDKDTNNIYTIDFDDACYGWYTLDVSIAIDNIYEESNFSDYSLVESAFLNGYQSVYPLHPLEGDHLKKLVAFQTLYQYTRNLRSTNEKWDNEPEWMTHLRSKINLVQKKLLDKLLNTDSL